MERCVNIGDELLCKPTLLQTIDAVITSEMFVPPGNGVALSLPYLPNEYSVCWDPNEIHYGHPAGKPYYFRREPDGLLVKRESPDEPDYAMQADLSLVDSLRRELYGAIFAVDAAQNFYGRAPSPRMITAYTWDRKPIAKFELVGLLHSWYLNSSGTLCVITTNCGFDRGKKNLLRVYRLDLPDMR